MALVINLVNFCKRFNRLETCVCNEDSATQDSLLRVERRKIEMTVNGRHLLLK